MRPRRIKMAVSVMGFTTPIAEASITSFAKLAEVKDYIDRVCPVCATIPKWEGRYVCQNCKENLLKVARESNLPLTESEAEDKATYTHWSKLRECVKGTTREIKRLALRQKGEDILAKIYRMPLEKFRHFADATVSEYGLTVKDSTSGKNIKKLLIAVRKLGQVIILTWNDEYEQRIALLTISESDRIVIREIMPLNLGEIEETLRVSLTDVSEAEVTEAEQFIKTLPEATEETLKVQDWRTETIPQVVSTEKAKVQDLEQILATIPPAK